MMYKKMRVFLLKKKEFRPVLLFQNHSNSVVRWLLYCILFQELVLCPIKKINFRSEFCHIEIRKRELFLANLETVLSF